MEATEGTVAATEVTPVTPVTPVTSEDTAASNTEATAAATDNELDEGYDPIEDAIRARLDLERERIQAEATAAARTHIEAERVQSEQRRAAEQHQSQLRNTLADTIKRTRDGLKGVTVYNEQGVKSTLSDEAIEELVVKPVQQYNATVEQAVQQRLYQDLATTAHGTMSEQARADFATKATNKPLDEWLRTYAEVNAPASEYVKTLEREIDVKVKAAEARGFAKGQKAPAGSAPRNTERTASPSSQNLDLSSQLGLATALSTGAISEAEYLERRSKLT